MTTTSGLPSSGFAGPGAASSSRPSTSAMAQKPSRCAFGMRAAPFTSCASHTTLSLPAQKSSVAPTGQSARARLRGRRKRRVYRVLVGLIEAAPLDLVRGEHAGEIRRRQRARRRLARAPALANLAHRVGGAVPVVLARTVGVTMPRIDARARIIRLAPADELGRRAATVGQALVQLITNTGARPRHANVVDTNVATTPLRRRAIRVGGAGNIFADGAATRRRRTRLGGRALEIGAAIVHTGAYPVHDRAVLIRRARDSASALACRSSPPSVREKSPGGSAPPSGALPGEGTSLPLPHAAAPISPSADKR